MAAERPVDSVTVAWGRSAAGAGAFVSVAVAVVVFVVVVECWLVELLLRRSFFLSSSGSIDYKKVEKNFNEGTLSLKKTF